MLTIVGLVASAGVLYLGTLFADISIWSMNFALMFALALGIDYALFIVVRYRAAHFGQRPVTGRCRRRCDGHRRQGRALLRRHRSHLALGGDARAEPSVPIDGARDHGRRRRSSSPLPSRCFLRCSARSDRRSTTSPCPGRTRASTAHRSSPRWAERIWATPLLYGIPALLVLLALAAPVLGLKTGMPSIKVVPAGDTLPHRLHPGAGRVRRRRPGRAAARRRPSATPPRSPRPPRQTPASRAVMPTQTSSDGSYALVQAIPRQNPSDPAVGRTIDRLRSALPAGALVGGAAAENHDLETRARKRDAARDRRRAGARVPAAAHRAAGARDRSRRRAHEPARNRRSFRGRPPDLPGRAPRSRCSASSRRASSTPGGLCSSSP